VVAIADVAHYVRPNTALDAEAYRRGNSYYFPDRVMPMLPEALSNGLCSLRPDEDRACMAVEMEVGSDGALRQQRVIRGLMRSRSRLTYNRVQAAIEGAPDADLAPLMTDVIEPLVGAYRTLAAARARRGTVELAIPERKAVIENGRIVRIDLRVQKDAHKLIEEMMILANVAVARALAEAQHPLIYRTHGPPDSARLEATKTFLRELGFKMGKTVGLKPKDFNALLAQADETPEQKPLVHELILRSMAQAQYSPDNIGHFGLALEEYAHFTSPIRRYADLIVHRCLIKALKLPSDSNGQDAVTGDEVERLAQISEAISATERTAMIAERDATNRYVALYLSEAGAASFAGHISGVTRAGLFVRLDETGAEGLVPMRFLPHDFYVHDETRHCLVGRETGEIFRLCQALVVTLADVNLMTGQLTFGLDPETHQGVTVNGQDRDRFKGHNKHRGDRRTPRRQDRHANRGGGRGSSGPDERGPNPPAYGRKVYRKRDH
jgi:ribonuclease R